MCRFFPFLLNYDIYLPLFLGYPMCVKPFINPMFIIIDITVLN